MPLHLFTSLLTLLPCGVLLRLATFLATLQPRLHIVLSPRTESTSCLRPVQPCQPPLAWPRSLHRRSLSRLLWAPRPLRAFPLALLSSHLGPAGLFIPYINLSICMTQYSGICLCTWGLKVPNYLSMCETCLICFFSALAFLLVQWLSLKSLWIKLICHNFLIIWLKL